MFLSYSYINKVKFYIIICKSLKSVMLYKIHKEPLEVGTAANTLISVIYYNIYNVTK